MTILKPRYYQDLAYEKTFDAWDRGVQRAALVQATGTGKTVVFSRVASTLVRDFRRRPGILVHRDELVDQAYDKLIATDPGLRVGVIKAERHETKADAWILSAQTLIRRLGTGKKGLPSDFLTDLIIDECHHAAAASYVSIMKHFGVLPENHMAQRHAHADTGSRALGVTATLARADGIPLGHIWEEVVYEYGTAQGIADGYLVMPRAERATLKDLDLSKVKSIGGDWSEGDLGVQMFKAGGPIAEKLLASGRNAAGQLRRTIVFAPTVACAHMWAEDFADAGIRCRIVTGTTPKPERRAAYAATAAGENDALISVMVLTEGFDLPSVEVAVIGRPTKSLPLYTQMVGRVLRPSPETGKEGALVLDVCGVMNEKLTTLVDLGLPPACGCSCDCDFEHLCPQFCTCPRSRKGKLKRPCLVCVRSWHDSPREERASCMHYQGGHVVGCKHRCDGIGKPGIHDEDEDTDVILDPEAPEPKDVLIDESSIETKEVDLFDLNGKPVARRVADQPKTKPKCWMTTDAGRPFLPATSTFEFLIFLHKWPDKTWSVGEKPSKITRSTPQDQRRAKMLASNLTFAEAVREAEDSHPSGGRLGRPLAGMASEGQLGVLQREGIAIPKNCSKQQASDLIAVLFASRSLD